MTHALNRTSSLFANLKRTAEPQECPVSLDDIKQHLRIDDNSENQYLQGCIKAATSKVENDTKRGFVTQTWKQYLDDFDDDLILLRRCPVIAVSSITYVDTNGDSQTISSADYQVDVASEPARVYPAYGDSWPTVRSTQLNAITVTFTVGYGAANAAHHDMELARHAIRMLVATFYMQRCALSDAAMVPVPLAYEGLIDALRWE